MSEAVTISVPAQTGFIHVLRAVVASLAARLDFSYDDIEDLRLAVDEACAHLLSARAPARQIALDITLSPGHLEILLHTDAEPAEWPPPNAEHTLTWQVLSTLADTASLHREGTRPAIRFAKQRAAAR